MCARIRERRLRRLNLWIWLCQSQCYYPHGMSTQRTTPDSLLTVEQAARRLNIARSTAWRLIATGELPAIRVGSHPRAPVRIDPRELDEWLRR
jgi:excisionase family DNA binding protein